MSEPSYWIERRSDRLWLLPVGDPFAGHFVERTIDGLEQRVAYEEGRAAAITARAAAMRAALESFRSGSGSERPTKGEQT